MVIANKNNSKVNSVSKVNTFILQVFPTLLMTFLDDVEKKCLVANNFNFVEENCRDLDIELKLLSQGNNHLFINQSQY